MKWTEEDLAQKLRENPGLSIADLKQIPLSKVKAEKTINKYHVAKKEDRIYNGILYASKKELLKAQELDLQVNAGEIDFWLRQIPFMLPGGVIYRLDFMTFTEVETLPLYEIHYIEVKGKELALGRTKRKQSEAIYNISIEVV